MLRSLPILILLAACNSQAATSTPSADANTASTTAPAAAGSMREVDLATFKTDLDSGKVPVLFDVRTPGEYAEGHVAGAKLVPLQELETRLAEFEPHKDQEIYLICRSGARSHRAAQLLKSKGYNTVNIQGGTAGWIASGGSVER